MGVDIHGARFLLGEKSRGLRLGKTLTLGRQSVYMSQSRYLEILSLLGTVAHSRSSDADDFFLAMGAEPLLSMDASSYEGATLIHDINNPVDPSLHSAFDTVIDGGTLEHVFNFPSAIKNCMQMVRTGGHLILITPWHNYAGHGFYQFSPELFYNILSESNGYHIERMLISSGNRWYSIKDPSKIKCRVEIHTPEPTLLYISAKRINEAPVLSKWPQQSDYSATWQAEDNPEISPSLPTKLKSSILSHLPSLENLQLWWRSVKYRRSLAPGRNPALVPLNSSNELPKLI